MKNFFPRMRRFKPGRKKVWIIRLFWLSLFFWILGRIIPGFFVSRIESRMLRASRIMSLGMKAVQGARGVINVPINLEEDINRTGMIGKEWTPLTTTMGNIEAKRTTTNPNWAAALVWLLHKSKVQAGDTVAVGASGSFPALILAAYAAAGAMDLDLLVEVSLGASQWGSNEPDFHWLKMQDCLMEAGIIMKSPVAVSLGGERDIGRDMEPEGRRILLKEIRRRGLNLVYEPDLEENVNLKMDIYRKRAGNKPIKAFINIGGSYSNLGMSSLVLEVDPGMADINRWPPDERRGILFEMAARGVRVIHLLYIRGLARSCGLPWDPVPLPGPGEGAVYQMAREESGIFAALGLVYILCTVIILLIWRPLNR